MLEKQNPLWPPAQLIILIILIQHFVFDILLDNQADRSGLKTVMFTFLAKESITPPNKVTAFILNTLF